MSAVIFSGCVAAVQKCTGKTLKDRSDRVEKAVDKASISFAVLDLIAIVGLVVAGALVCRGKTSLPVKVSYPMFGTVGAIVALWSGLMILGSRAISRQEPKVQALD